MVPESARRARWRRYWDRHSTTYDREMRFFDRVGDADALCFPSATFDTVVCTFSLCAIPDHRQALAEMTRVLRPGGLLLLADHVASSVQVLRASQRILELAAVPLGGEHSLRRPIEQVRAAGFRIDRHDRFAAGVVERLAARKPGA